MLVTLLIMGVYFTFNKKNISSGQEENTCASIQGESVCVSISAASEPFLEVESKVCFFDLLGIINDLNFNWCPVHTFRLKKIIDNNNIFKFKLQSESEKVSQNSKIINLENTLSISRNCDIYLYLKKLLI